MLQERWKGKMLLALLKMALAALLRALLNIASKALLEKLF